MNEPREMTLLSKAHKALAQASTVDEIRELRDQATAVKAYARKAKLGQHLVIEAATIRVRAERRLGEMLRTIELAHAAPGNQHTHDSVEPQSALGKLTLRELGLTKSESSRSQQIANLPDKIFETYLAQSAAAVKEPTSAGLLRLARQINGPTREVNPDRPDAAASLVTAPLPTGEKFAAGFFDPPWNDRTDDSAKRAPRLSVDDLCRLPAADLFADEAHLHVWTWPRRLLPALDVLDAWGFRYRSCLVCAVAAAGPSRHWRSDHGLLLLGVRGSLPFVEPNLPGRVDLDSLPDAQRRAAMLAMIERVSPPPYVELFGAASAGRPSWTCSDTEHDTRPA